MRRLLAFALPRTVRAALWYGVCALGFVSAPSAFAQAPVLRPHILLLVADDLGFSDVGYNGGKDAKTPNLDRIAATGTRLTQFYVQPLCSPTRAALMTGRYPMRHGLQTSVVKPWATYGLPLEEQLLPQALKTAGYRTVILGKWHLGCHEAAYLPHQRGFDHQYGQYLGAIDYFDHTRDGGLDWHRNGEALREEGYSTDLLAAEGERLIAAHDPATPLFLYLPFNAPHTPLQATKELLARFPDLTGARKTYAAMVSGVDDSVGRIVAALEKRGMWKDTLLLFTSDNGGPTGAGATNVPLRGGKGGLREGGVRSAAFAAWPGRIPAGASPALMHAVDWYPTILRAAGAAGEPPLPLDGLDMWDVLTAGKPSPREEVLLNVESYRGAIRRGDWKLAWGGKRMDADGEGPVPDRGGSSVAPALGTGRGAEKKTGKGAKKKAAADPDPEAGAYELYNLAEDPGEANDVAAKHPEKVAELKARLEAYAAQAVPAKSRPPAKDFKAPEVWGPPDGNPKSQFPNSK